MTATAAPARRLGPPPKGATTIQRAYLRAFDKHLQAQTAEELLATRLEMTDLLACIRSERELLDLEAE